MQRFTNTFRRKTKNPFPMGIEEYNILANLARNGSTEKVGSSMFGNDTNARSKYMLTRNKNGMPAQLLGNIVLVTKDTISAPVLYDTIPFSYFSKNLKNGTYFFRPNRSTNYNNFIKLEVQNFNQKKPRVLRIGKQVKEINKRQPNNNGGSSYSPTNTGFAKLQFELQSSNLRSNKQRSIYAKLERARAAMKARAARKARAAGVADISKTNMYI